MLENSTQEKLDLGPPNATVRELYRNMAGELFRTEVAENAEKLKKHVANLKEPAISERTRTIAKNFLEKRITHSFRFFGNYVEFDMFAIPNVYKHSRKLIMEGYDCADAVESAVEKYRLHEKSTLH